MERRQKLRWGICFAVGFFGVVAAALGIAAELKHVRVQEVVVIGDDCFYPNNPAWVLGVIAASALLAAQVLANACGGCICCCKNRNTMLPSPTVKSVAILCLVLSWISFCNAFFLLLEGAALNGQQQYSGQGMIHSCYIIKPGVFAAGAVLSLFTTTLVIVYYLMATSGLSSSSPTLRAAPHNMNALNHHVGAPMFGFNPDYSFASHLPYVSGLELPKRYDHF